MRRFMNLVALTIILGVNILIPISYAQEINGDLKNSGKFSEESSIHTGKNYGIWEDIPVLDEIKATLIEDVNNPEEKKIVTVIDKSFDYMLYSRRQVQDGVEFAEWYDNADFRGEPFDYHNITQDVTLYAKWVKKISYQDGAIKLSNGGKSILVKNVNEGGNLGDVSKYKRVMELRKDENYCHFEEFEVSVQKYKERVFVCTPDFYEEVSNILGMNVENLGQIDDYFKSIYGNYYFRGNNGYAKYDELIPTSSWSSEMDVHQDAYNRGFLNYSNVSNPDIGWKESDMGGNPCDLTKGEYMPTPENWAELMSLWNDINGVYIEEMGENLDNPVIDLYLSDNEKENLSSDNGSIYIGNPSVFQQDLLVPAAGYVNYVEGGKQTGLTYYSSLPILWTSMSNGGRLGWLDLEEGSLYGDSVDNYAYPVRCFLVEDPVTVEFNTNGGSDVDSYQVAEGKMIKSPSVPTKNGYTFDGWFKDKKLLQQWDFDKDEVEGEKVTLYAKWRVCGKGFTVMNNKCVPDNMNGTIGVSDGINTIFIKDKNVGAESKCSSELYQLSELYNRRCVNIVGPIGGGGTERGLSKGLDSRCLNDEDFFAQVNNIIKDVDINTIDEFDAYMNSTNQKCVGNYYFRGNNVGVNYSGLNINKIDKTNPIMNVDELFEVGFNGGKFGAEGGNGWIQGNTDNPCNGTGEYLPTPDDWSKLMAIWGKNNGYMLMGKANEGLEMIDDPVYPGELIMRGVVEPEDSSSYGETNKGGTQGFVEPEANDKFQRDMLIPNVGMVSHVCEVETEPVRGKEGGCIDRMYYDFKNGWWTAQNRNGYVGMFNGSMIVYDTFANLSEILLQSPNDIAVPVRCFVNVPEVLVVTFSSDEKVIDEINVVEGGILKEPKAPEKSGVVFGGWYTENGEKYDFTTPIMKDLELYAKWLENKGNGHSAGGGVKKSSTLSDKNLDKSVVLVNEKNIEKSDLSDVKGVKNISSQQGGVNASSDSVMNKTDDTKNNVSVNGGGFTDEFNEAYNYSKKNGITTKSSINDAGMYYPLTRIQMAKMLSNYAINVLRREPDISKGVVKFNDVTNKLDEQYDNGVTLSYQLGIMGQNMPNNNFRPNDIVTRAEFAAAFSRMLYGISDGKYVSSKRYYTYHMQKLREEGIITNTNPSMEERRGYVMVMLKRAASN